MSGLFTNVSTLLMSVIGDPSQNNWWGGSPRAQNTFPNGPGGAPALGDPLTLDALTKAGELMQYYKARIFWLGNDFLAAKYGTTMPEVLPPVEQEMWNRQVGVLQYAVIRIQELLEVPPGLRARNQAVSPEQKQAAPPKQEQAAPPEQKQAAPPEQKQAATPEQKQAAPPEQKQAAPPEQKQAAPSDSLADRFRGASPEERSDLVKLILNGLGSS